MHESYTDPRNQNSDINDPEFLEQMTFETEGHGKLFKQLDVGHLQIAGVDTNNVLHVGSLTKFGAGVSEWTQVKTDIHLVTITPSGSIWTIDLSGNLQFKTGMMLITLIMFTDWYSIGP